MTNRKSFKKKVKLNVRIMNFIRAILLRQMVQFLFFGRTRGMPPRKSHDLDWYQIQIDHCNYAICIGHRDVDKRPYNGLHEGFLNGWILRNIHTQPYFPYSQRNGKKTN